MGDEVGDGDGGRENERANCNILLHVHVHLQQLMAGSALIICCVGLLVFFVRDLNCASIYFDVHAC